MDTSFQRMLQITGHLSTAHQQLEQSVRFSDQLATLAGELEELKALSALPGAEVMYQKYASLLHPYLAARNLAGSAVAPPAWDANAAMRSVLSRLAEVSRADAVIDAVKHLGDRIDRAEAGGAISDEEFDRLAAGLPDLASQVNEVSSLHPSLQGLFDTRVKRFWSYVGGRQLDRGLSLAQDDPVPARLHFTRSNDAFETADDVDGQGIALFATGQTWHHQDAPAEAEDCYRRARDCFQQTGNKTRECLVVRGWGNLCREIREAGRARELYEDGLELARGVGQREQEAEFYRLIAETWSDEGQLDQAIVSCQSALQIAQETGAAAQEREVWGTLGRLYAHAGSRQDAVQAFERQLDMVERDAEPEVTEHVKVLLDLSRAYQAVGRADEAAERWDQALARSAEISQEVQEMIRASGRPGGSAP